MTPILGVRDLRVAFNLPEGRLVAVDGVSFRVRQGSTLALVGESGSGKTVVSQAILGILPRTARIEHGQILFRDPARRGTTSDIARLEPDGRPIRAIRGGRISIIFQEPMSSLSPLHTIGDQIGEVLALHKGVRGREGRLAVRDMLELVGFPSPARALDRYPFELSGGLRQRAMIAMALICRPALLIADEPTTALDVTIQAQILKLLKDLQAELGMAVLIITHDLGVVANLAEEVVVMYRGRVVESGPIEPIFNQPGHPYLQALMRAVPRFGMKPGERLVPLREVKGETGHMMAAPAPWPEGADAAGPLLRVTGVSKTYTTRKAGWFGGAAQQMQALDDVSLEVRRGECLGLVGESGCGKTTLSKVILRAVKPDAGSVVFNDRGQAVDVLAMDRQRLTAFRPRMQFIFQDPFSALNPRMTVADIIAEPLEIHGIGTPQSRIETVRELLALVGLDIRHLRRYPHSFSGGQRQRIGIARALALKPDLLLCDEPVSALDVSIQAQILNLLKDLKDRLGLTYLFVSHNLAVVDYVADRIAVMCAGRIVELAPRESLFRRPQHPYTRALLAAVPEPSLERRLDFTAVLDGKASVPAAWPAPYTVDREHRPGMVDIGDGHLVRMDATPLRLDLAS
ncbi:MAG: ABC transporter ATP-binding protein [Thalassobaculales bacterium]